MMIDEVKWNIGDIKYVTDINVKWYDEYETSDLENDSQIIIEIVGQPNDKIYESCPDFVTAEFAVKTPTKMNDIDWYKSLITECLEHVEHTMHHSRLHKHAESIKAFVDNKLTKFDYSDINKWEIFPNGTAYPDRVIFRTTDKIKQFVYVHTSEYIEYDPTFIYPSTEDINKALSSFIKSESGSYIMNYYMKYKKLIEG